MFLAGVLVRLLSVGEPGVVLGRAPLDHAEGKKSYRISGELQLRTWPRAEGWRSKPTAGSISAVTPSEARG
jgi:hypothetical protein